MSDTPRVPSAYQLERAVSAWQQIRATLAADPNLIDDENVITAALADADITHPEVLLGRLIDAIVWTDRREDEAEEMRKEAIARRDRYAARGVDMRTLLLDLMTALDKKSHRSKLGRASVGTSKPAVVITDEGVLPDEYVRVERHPNRTLIHEDIDLGVVIPGATLSNAAPNVRVARL